MNKHDSERLAGVLTQEGYEFTEDLESADVIVFNTCSVREHAAQRLYGRLSSLKPLKEKSPDIIIAVGGCLAQQEGAKIQRRLPYVDVVFGTYNLSHFARLIKEAQHGSRNVCELLDGPDGMPTDLPSLRQNQWQAWVSIIIGCDNFCSYCIVPYVRGRERSRPREDILAEVEKLSSEGVKEITLLGQNVNSYGRNIYGESNFAALLREVNKIDDTRRIRFLTSHPKDLTEDIIEAATSSKVCEHFHLPIQAGSDRILELMNRGYTQKQYLNLVKRIRQRIPSASITTDIIVGFPGETEDDFRETLRVIEEVCFDQAFTFIYSPRQGTAAALMNNQVLPEVKNSRFNQLCELQNRINLEQNLKYSGKFVEILVEGPSKKNSGHLTGRTRTNKVVNFVGSPTFVGQFVRVKIEEVHTWYLKGTLKNSEFTQISDGRDFLVPP